MKIQTDESGNPILEQFSEEGFVDCVFRILDLVESPDYYNFHLSACSEGEVLGMDVALRRGIQHGLDNEMKVIADHVYRPGVMLIRSGIESDKLVARIAALYGFGPSEGGMISKEIFTAIALHDHPIDLATTPVKLKLFGKDAQPFVEEEYNESFFNVDLANGIVCWNEKDPDYRAPLIRALQAGA